MIQIPDPSNPGKILNITRDVWNPTVANLTLMALGSSMPEILLSCFSTVLDLEATPDVLGPAAIIGSAAFNLLVISGISILAVTVGFKYINDVSVFLWTCIASTFAYVWFYIVLVVQSPDWVELWEALLTFFFFIVLVVVAYCFDRRTSSKLRA